MHGTVGDWFVSWLKFGKIFEFIRDFMSTILFRGQLSWLAQYYIHLNILTGGFIIKNAGGEKDTSVTGGR